MAITAIINPRILEKPTNKQAATIFMQRQFANSRILVLYEPLIIIEFEKKANIKSGFESKTSQSVRFKNKLSTCQILKLKTLQIVRF